LVKEVDMMYAKQAAAAAFVASPFAVTAAGLAFGVSIGERGWSWDARPTMLGRVEVFSGSRAAQRLGLKALDEQ